jgi:hypothetical protein
MQPVAERLRGPGAADRLGAVVGQKWYGKDIGELKEADVVGGDESYALVSVSHN